MTTEQVSTEQAEAAAAAWNARMEAARTRKFQASAHAWLTRDREPEPEPPAEEPPTRDLEAELDAAVAVLHEASERAAIVEADDVLPPEALEDAAIIDTETVPRVWPSAAALAHAIAVAPCPVRLATGIPRLDEWTHGGVPTARRVVLVGAPGAGKTALAVQWSHEWAPSARVVYLAADQSAEDVLCRIGQRMGLWRDDLDGVSGEEPRRAAWSHLAERLSELPELIVLDGATHTVEDAVACALAPSDAPARVVVIDSIQTARCAAAEGAASRRDGMDAILQLVRDACSQGVLAVLVSEMARAGYKSGDPSQMTSALASAKESGSVEYGADLLLGLRSVAGEPDLVDVEVAKSRLGPRGDLRLRLERSRATLHETDAPDPSERIDTRAEARTALARARHATVAGAVAMTLAAQPGLTTRALRDAVRARLGSCTDGDTGAAVSLLGRAVVMRVGARCAQHHYLDGALVPAVLLATLGADDRARVGLSRPPADEEPPC